MKPSIINAHSAYSFTDYFKLSNYIEEILDYFGYTLSKAEYDLPRSTTPLERLADLTMRLKENLPHVSLTSEAARREFLIAPVLMEVVHYTGVNIKVEWPLTINEQLKGTLDYYLEAQGRLLVIEAKNADIESGFSQLAAELVALDHWTESATSALYGAVSTGNIWQFGVLHRAEKHITQDLNLFRVPADLEDLLRILVAVLSEK
jgi:hypothetical protein